MQSFLYKFIYIVQIVLKNIFFTDPPLISLSCWVGTHFLDFNIFMLQEGDGPVAVSGELTGLDDGLHGFHVHQVIFA